MENVELDLNENGAGNTCFDASTEDDYDMVVGGESTEQTRNSNETSSQCVYNPQVLDEVKPRIGQEFATLHDVQKFYNSYAKAAGFSIQNWSVRKSKLTNEIMRK